MIYLIECSFALSYTSPLRWPPMSTEPGESLSISPTSISGVFPGDTIRQTGPSAEESNPFTG